MNKDMLLALLGLALLLTYKRKEVRTPAQNRALYASAFASASRQFDIPEDLLIRVAQQESHFRSDIISGKVISRAGALGIMQIVPRFHPNINPLDPVAAIHYGARFLRQMYVKYGNWPNALQAYNWGPGNLDKYLAGETRDGEVIKMPSETVKYHTQILRDVEIV